MTITAKAHEIMTSPVITAKYNTSLRDAETILKEKKITGLPVVNDDNEVVGVISEKHLLSIYDIRSDEQDVTDLAFRLPYECRTWVEEIMTKGVISVNEETPLVEVCRLMVENHIHRVPVLRGRKLVGIISSLDLAKHMLRLCGEKGKEE